MHITELISAFFTSSGPGGVVILTVVSLAAGIYFWLTRWILRGGEPGREEEDRYRFR
jgi:hypothetical protein